MENGYKLHFERLRLLLKGCGKLEVPKPLLGKPTGDAI